MTRFARTLPLLWISACFPSGPGGPPVQAGNGNGGGGSGGACASCRRGGASGGGSSTGGAATSGSGTGGSTGGAGTSSGGSTGGSAGDAGASPADAGSCEQASGPPPKLLSCTGVAQAFAGDAGSCPQDWFGTVLVDYSTCNAVCGATVQLLDQNGAPLPYSQASDAVTGQVHLCLPAGLTYTPSVSAQGYPTFYAGEIQGQLTRDLRGIAVLPDHTISAISGILPGGLDPGKGAAMFILETGTCSKAGWSVSLALPDGGAYPDGSYDVHYFDANALPSSSLSATSSFGVAILANIDPTLGAFAVPVYQNPDAGSGCAVQNLSFGYTGRLYVSQGAFSEQMIYLP